MVCVCVCMYMCVCMVCVRVCVAVWYVQVKDTFRRQFSHLEFELW